MYSKHDELIPMGYDYIPRVERTEARRFQDHVENDKNLVCVTHLAHDVIERDVLPCTRMPMRPPDFCKAISVLVVLVVAESGRCLRPHM